ncbi:NADPH-dependent FMN reductase [Frankia sp. AgKG'84/4]
MTPTTPPPTTPPPTTPPTTTPLIAATGTRTAGAEATAAPAPGAGRAAPPDTVTFAVLIGSVRSGRLGPTVTRWFTEQADARPGPVLDVVDLAGTALAAGARTAGDPAAEDEHRAIGRRLAAADGFVIVTPEYNHSYPAALKHLIDSYRQEWYAKPVGFVSYGGLGGGLRAVEHLRGVFAEQHAVCIRDGVSLHGMGPADFAAGGRVAADPQPGASARHMVGQLAWWAMALRDARAVRPYQP